MSVFSRLAQIVRAHLNDLQPEARGQEFYTPPPPRPSASTNTPPQDPIRAAYYANLELPYGASWDDIKRQYRKLLAKSHPDLYTGKPDQQPIADELSKKLNEAYEYFKNERMNP